MKRAIWVVTSLLASSVICLAAEPSPVPSARPGGGGNASVDVTTRTLPVHPVAVKPLTGGEAPGSSSSQLGPGNQSAIGAGLQIHFGKGAKEKSPADDSSDDDEKDDN